MKNFSFLRHNLIALKSKALPQQPHSLLLRDSFTNFKRLCKDDLKEIIIGTRAMGINPSKLAEEIHRYLNHYPLEIPEDLLCVHGLGKETLKRLKPELFPFSILPPHVRLLVNSEQRFNDITGDECGLKSLARSSTSNCQLVLHINIRGLKAKIQVVEYLVHMTKPAVFCLTETNRADKKDVKITGYKLCLENGESQSQINGVAIYVKNDFDNMSKECLKLNWNDDQVKSKFVQLKNSYTHNSLIVGAIYRHPKPNDKVGLKTFRTHLAKVLKSFKDETVYIVGDFNIDLLEFSHVHIDYCEMLDKHNYKLLITRHTRMGQKTLVNHIYTNDQNSSASGRIKIDSDDLWQKICNKAGTLNTTKLDHYPVYSFVKF